ncbi:MAG TPA: hypothetical protein VKU40_16795, partial [Thermoanaerobaculia bacterium]|nr:hypothetical protein [Thermoanaerobaculia bacterium]
MGRYWSHSYAQRIVPDPDDSHVWLITDRATFREFGNLDGVSGEYETLRPSDEYRRLFRTVGGWQLVAPDGTVTAFDDDGLWLSTTDRNGNDTTAVYTGTQLDEVHFADGRHELFTYHPLGHATEGKLETITEVGVLGAASRTWAYSWSGDDLTRIDRPDGTAWVMSYSTDPDLPGYLTRIELSPAGGLEPDRVLVAWEYDAEGNVKETWRGAGAYADPQAVDRWAFAYDDPANPTETVVTDPLGDDATYTFDRDPKSEKPRVTRIEGDCPTCGLGPSSEIVYDGDHPLRPEQITDGNGNVTRFTYNDAGEVATRTDAFGHPTLERTTTWTHDSTFEALVESIVQPSVDGSGDGRRTDVVRDPQGNEVTRTVSGVEGGAWVEPAGPVVGAAAFSVTTVTEPNDAGLPLWIDPEDDGGFGTADRTELTYDGDRGDLVPLSRTDPVVGTTSFTHDPFNRRTLVTDPNGVVTETQYDALDRVTAVIRHGAVPADDLVTVYAYDDYGDLASVTQPEGNFTEYTYDAAGRLTEIARWNAAQTAGERVVYLLDRAGNRIHEEHSGWDPQAAEWAPPDSWTSYFYETRCRLDRLVQPDGTMGGAVTEYDYDCNGNLERVWDAAHPSNQKMNPPTTTYAYDARDRLVSVTRPWTGAGGGNSVTTYGYDAQDHLTRVTDAEGSDTFYTYSDRDLLVRESSPVAGVTLHTYDLHGELATTTDARGVTVTRSLDAADRVTAVDHPNPLEADVAYTYDGGPFGLGRLTSITRGGVTVAYAYDRFGRLTQDGELAYGYDGNGNRTSIAHPDGVTATYGYDHADRQVTLSVEHDAVVTDVVTAAGYLPNGPLASLAFGNGVTETRGFDLRYLPDAIALAAPRNRSWDYWVDEMGNVTAIVGMGDCAGDVTLTGVTVSEPEAHSSCAALLAGPGVTVAATGDLELTAATRVIFEDGFSVADGGRLTAGTDPALSGDVTKSYGYQDVDYFLGTATGPWGTQSWTYDRIGNRLNETANGFTDLYTYDGNGSSGNTALLRSISLGVGAERTFDYTDAGHQTVSSASGNAVTFTYDDSGRLAEADRSGSGPPVPFVYDGRSFLRTAGDLTTTGTVTATYDSAGLLHSLLRQENVAASPQRYHLFHLAGRPVAQLAPDTGEGDRWWYFTTDHLGTPLVATAADGSEIWESRFEPFGTDAAA